MFHFINEIRILDAEPDMEKPLTKAIIDYMTEQGRISENKEYDDMKKQMNHDGVCEEDAELTIATIKRLRGKKTLLIKVKYFFEVFM